MDIPQLFRPSLKKTLIILFFIVLTGGFLRFYNLSTSPYWMDEGYTINAVLSIEEKGVSVLDSGNTYKCPLYCYPTAWIAQTLGDNAFSYRLLAAIAGILFIILAYIVSRKFFGLQVALASAFFVSFSYFQIAWSRQARWYTLFELFFWLSLLLFHLFLESKGKKKHLYSFLSVAAAGLAILTHSLGWLLPLIFFIWSAYVSLSPSSSSKPAPEASASRPKTKSLLLPGLAIIAILILLFFKFHPALYYTLPYYLSFYFRTYWLFIIFALFALFEARPGTSAQEKILFILFPFLAYLIPLAFFTNIVHYRYLFHVTPTLIILGALGMHVFSNKFIGPKQRSLFWTVIIAVFITVGGGNIVPQNQYLLESDDPEKLGDRPSYAYTPQPNWNGAYDYIKTNKKEGEITISTQPQFNKIFLNEPGYWIKYNYLGYDKVEDKVKGDTEFYVGAKVIDDLAELQSLISSSHGFIILDVMATDRLPLEMLDYINENLELVFNERTNYYSEVWVYQF